jgi:hypothetical protein
MQMKLEFEALESVWGAFEARQSMRNCWMAFLRDTQRLQFQTPELSRFELDSENGA